MENGYYIQGILKGYIEKPWSTNPERFNRQIGIATATYDDQWGQKQENIVNVDVAADNSEAVRKIVNALVGKTVVLQVVPRARKGGRDGAWLSVFMPSTAVIREVKTADLASVK